MPQRRATTQPGEEVIQHDAVNEAVVVAAALADEGARNNLLGKHRPDHFFAQEHADAWRGMLELKRKGLAFDLAALQQVAKVDVEYLEQLARTRPDLPENLDFHSDRLLWDHARLTAASGPVSALVRELRNPLAEPDRVRALARQVSTSFDGYQERSFLRDPGELVRDQMYEIRARLTGRTSYSYGIDRLDYYETPSASGHPIRRMIPGAAPGQVTVITGTPGAGKTTVTARVALGLARNKRRVLYGAWEVDDGMSLELMACMSCGFDRSMVLSPTPERQLSEEQLAMLEARMRSISRWVRFLENPFNKRRGEKRSNDRALDAVHGYIADSGCDVFIADLWKRCLSETKPEEEEQALIRQQAIAEETKTHHILVQQQRSKDVEQRADKRPTREGIKGSGAWTEVPDTILGVHRPALWKNITDNVLEIDVLKQRWGKWPQAIEFDWDGDTGLISGGVTVPYDAFSDGGNSGGVNDLFKVEPRGRRRR